jgi:hypothetical protein
VSRPIRGKVDDVRPVLLVHLVPLPRDYRAGLSGRVTPNPHPPPCV